MSVMRPMESVSLSTSQAPSGPRAEDHDPRAIAADPRCATCAAPYDFTTIATESSPSARATLPLTPVAIATDLLPVASALPPERVATTVEYAPVATEYPPRPSPTAKDQLPEAAALEPLPLAMAIESSPIELALVTGPETTDTELEPVVIEDPPSDTTLAMLPK